MGIHFVHAFSICILYLCEFLAFDFTKSVCVLKFCAKIVYEIGGVAHRVNQPSLASPSSYFPNMTQQAMRLWNDHTHTHTHSQQGTWQLCAVRRGEWCPSISNTFWRWWCLHYDEPIERASEAKNAAAVKCFVTKFFLKIATFRMSEK